MEILRGQRGDAVELDLGLAGGVGVGAEADDGVAAGGEESDLES